MWNVKTENYLSRILFIGIPAISIFIIDGTVSDPVNAPKLFILGMVSSASIAVFCLLQPWTVIKKHVLSAVLIVAFIVFSIVTLFTSTSPFSQSFYGVYGRSNGFLTYFFLSALFLATSALKQVRSYRNLCFGLLTAGLVNMIYCGWVLIFGDFIGWNNPYGNILGTFGNPNFIGSFLGICLGVLFTFALSPGFRFRTRLLLLVPIPILLVEIYFSRAIQGRVLSALGFGIVILFWLKFNSTRLVLSAYSLLAAGLAGLALAGALQVGPLTSVIYKTSVSLRGQYWLSGWNTGNANPWNGAGFDSLGDWYRRMRDTRALELPGVDTVVNTAHNVPLDIFAFGGWPLFITYLLIFGLVGVKSLIFAIRMQNYDPIFISLFVAWLGYQLQSIISINQIGLAVWGWVLSGALLGYMKAFPTTGIPKNAKSEEKGRVSGVQRFVSPQLAAGVAIVIGGLISVPPLAGDMKWREAQDSGVATELEKSMEKGYLNPLNSYMYLINVQIFENSNLNDLAHRYALQAVEFNPDYYDAWRLLSLIKNSSEEDKQLALANMRRLDPKNPELG